MRKLQVKRIDTREIVHEIEIADNESDRDVQRIMFGMMRNMADGLFISDTADEVQP